MIDATFKPNPGILEGNVNWMGNYKECMKTDGLHYCTMTNVELNIGGLLRLLVSINAISRSSHRRCSIEKAVLSEFLF